MGAKALNGSPQTPGAVHVVYVDAPLMKTATERRRATSGVDPRPLNPRVVTLAVMFAVPRASAERGVGVAGAVETSVVPAANRTTPGLFAVVHTAESFTVPLANGPLPVDASTVKRRGGATVGAYGAPVHRDRHRHRGRRGVGRRARAGDSARHREHDRHENADLHGTALPARFRRTVPRPIPGRRRAGIVRTGRGGGERVRRPRWARERRPKPTPAPRAHGHR